MGAVAILLGSLNDPLHIVRVLCEHLDVGLVGVFPEAHQVLRMAWCLLSQLCLHASIDLGDGVRRAGTHLMRFGKLQNGRLFPSRPVEFHQFLLESGTVLTLVELLELGDPGLDLHHRGGLGHRFSQLCQLCEQVLLGLGRHAHSLRTMEQDGQHVSRDLETAEIASPKLQAQAGSVDHPSHSSGHHQQEQHQPVSDMEDCHVDCYRSDMFRTVQLEDYKHGMLHESQSNYCGSLGLIVHFSQGSVLPIRSPKKRTAHVEPWRPSGGFPPGASANGHWLQLQVELRYEDTPFDKSLHFDQSPGQPPRPSGP